MQTKKIDKKNYVFSIAFITIIGLFFIYEYVVIKNPFMDPIAPNILWGSMFLISLLLGIRIFQAIKE